MLKLLAGLATAVLVMVTAASAEEPKIEAGEWVEIRLTGPTSETLIGTKTLSSPILAIAATKMRNASGGGGPFGTAKCEGTGSKVLVAKYYGSGTLHADVIVSCLVVSE